MSNEKNSDQIGALWKKNGNKGEFFTGSVKIDGVETKIVVFANPRKTEDRFPDYHILKSNYTGGGSQGSSAASQKPAAKPAARPAAKQVDPDELPM